MGGASGSGDEGQAGYRYPIRAAGAGHLAVGRPQTPAAPLVSATLTPTGSIAPHSRVLRSSPAGKEFAARSPGGIGRRPLMVITGVNPFGLRSEFDCPPRTTMGKEVCFMWPAFRVRRPS